MSIQFNPLEMAEIKGLWRIEAGADFYPEPGIELVRAMRYTRASLADQLIWLVQRQIFNAARII